MNPPIDPRLDRRALLRAAALGGAVAAGGGVPGASPVRGTRKTRRVVLVTMSGGVRTRETLGTPGNVPNLMRMASEGVVYPRVRTSNMGHFGATLSVFTGIAEQRGIRDNSRGVKPTVFEYVRKDLGLGASDVWISTSGGAQQANYAFGRHPDYGAAFGANTVDGDGIFNAELRGIMQRYGRPRQLSGREAELLRSMRRAVGAGGERSLEERVNSEESFARVEGYLLEEFAGHATELRGTGAADAKAFRIGKSLLAAFRPTLLGVVLQDADVAHGNFSAYVEVVRRNDAMLGELWEAVRRDPDLADSTAILVVPEFGRDADLNSRRGLDHGDDSDDLNLVSLVAWGPDFRAGSEVREDVQTIDVCPTICELLGANARLARGRRLPKLYS